MGLPPPPSTARNFHDLRVGDRFAVPLQRDIQAIWAAISSKDTGNARKRCQSISLFETSSISLIEIIVFANSNLKRFCGA